MKLLLVLVPVFGWIMCGVAFGDRLPEIEVPRSATNQQHIGAIDKWLSTLQKQKQFNGGVLIAHRGKPLLMKTYGDADPIRGSKLTTKTPFRLASV